MSDQPPPLQEPEWYIGKDGHQDGPFLKREVLERYRRGEIDGTTLVWAPSEKDWVELALSSLRLELGARHSPSPVSDRLHDDDEALEYNDPSTVILLSFITCGIYGLIVYYKCGMSYMRLSGRQSNFETLFWIFVVTSYGGAFTTGIGVGFLLIIASIVVGAMSLSELLKNRQILAHELEVSEQLTPRDTHMSYWIIGEITSFILIGIVFLILQAVYFLRDNNVLHGACQDRQTIL